VAVCLSTTSAAHFADDIALFDFTLDAKSMKQIDALTDPGGSPAACYS
jgi:diketogulonate reductase-like aldo/keto reductase